MIQPVRHFNCCTGYAEPDWSLYSRLELGGCRNTSDHVDETCTTGGQSVGMTEFFTVYGRFHEPDGTCEAITDIVDPRAALAVAAELSTLSKLPVIVSPTLGER